MTSRIAIALLFLSCACLPAAAGVPPGTCGTHLLPRTHGLPKPASSARPAVAFQPGDTLTVPAYSFSGNAAYTTTTTCRWVGENCYVFVEDDVWDVGAIGQESVESLALAFDERTPRWEDRGIFSVNTETFGPPPDVDGDPRILYETERR